MRRLSSERQYWDHTEGCQIGMRQAGWEPVVKTRITILTQYPDEWFEQPAFEAKNAVVKDFIRLVAGEDTEMMRSLQNGVGSRHFRPGPTMGLEKAIHHLLNTYPDRMFGAAGVR